MIMGTDDDSAVLLAELRTWLGWERVLAPESVRCYASQAKAFLAAVSAVTSWRLSALPRGLTAAEIERLLAGCDRDTATGLRDYAVLSLLARLGLRGAEAAGLQLE
jgi:integrase